MIDINISLEDYNASSNPLCGVYMIKNKINGHMYIGQSVNIKHRFKEHKSQYEWNTHPNKHLYRAFKKHGIENFDFIILEECSKEELDEKEIKWIQKFNTFYNSEHYNEDKGGHYRKNYATAESTRLKIKEALKNHDQTGAKNPAARAVYCYELDISTDTLTDMAKLLNFDKKNGVAGISQVLNKSCRSQSYKGYHFCYLEDKDSISKEEWENKPTKSRVNKKILCIETNKIYNTLISAARDVGLKGSGATIARVCQGQAYTAAGLHWKYIEEE